MVPVPSVTRVNWAGDLLRSVLFTADWYAPTHAAANPDVDRLSEAIDVLVAWRTAHAKPLQAATMGLRSCVSTVNCSQIEVSQRLKRIPTILDKLRREPGMKLGGVEDIGGCRAVLRDLDEVYRVLGRYQNRSADVVRIRDYIVEPKRDGYRAVHVIVRYHGRRIEVQLRTQVQHEWAYTVESMTSRFNLDIKTGGGPQSVRDWFAAVSEAMALEEHGGTVGAELLEKVSTLRTTAQPYLRGRR